MAENPALHPGQRFHNKSLGEVTVVSVEAGIVTYANRFGDLSPLPVERFARLFMGTPTPPAPSPPVSRYREPIKPTPIAAAEIETGAPLPAATEFLPPPAPTRPPRTARKDGQFIRQLPRRYQTEALVAMTKAFQQYRDIVLALPTGSGKTFVAVKWVTDHVVSRGQRVLWVAHRKELLEQAEETFRRLAPEHSGQITWWTGGKPKEHHGRIVLMSVGAQASFPSDQEFDTLVIDEAHHEAASTYRALREKVRYRRHIGLTATPHRLDQKPLGYETIAYQKPFMSLVQEGFLARPTPVVPKTDMAFKMETRIGEFTSASLAKLNTPARNEFIVKHYLQNREQYKKTLVFAIDRDHARDLCQVFKAHDRSLSVEYVVSDETSAAERERIVRRFQQGELTILINCRIFTEGFDCPDIKTVFLTRPTLSTTLYMQMIGRGTRVCGSKRSFYLVDFEDMLGEFQEQLVRPWILNHSAEAEAEEEDPAAVEAALPESIAELDELPAWAQEELSLTPMQLSSLAGYVTYSYDSGRSDGFLVYAADEPVFLRAWDELSARTDRSSEVQLGRWALEQAESFGGRRLSSQSYVAAAMALAREAATYVSLRKRELPANVVAFLAEVGLTADETEMLIGEINQLHALVKFYDEFGEAYFEEVYTNETELFEQALTKIPGISGLRGEALRDETDRIYDELLLDTHLTRYKWQRHVIDVIKRGEESVLLRMASDPGATSRASTPPVSEAPSINGRKEEPPRPTTPTPNPAKAAPVSAPVQTAKRSSTGSELDLVDEECSALLKTIRARGLSMPMIGYEHLDNQGRVCAQAELAWPDRRLCVVLSHDHGSLNAMARQGWKTFQADTTSASPGGLLSLLSRNEPVRTPASIPTRADATAATPKSEQASAASAEVRSFRGHSEDNRVANPKSRESAPVAAVGVLHPADVASLEPGDKVKHRQLAWGTIELVGKSEIAVRFGNQRKSFSRSALSREFNLWRPLKKKEPEPLATKSPASSALKPGLSTDSPGTKTPEQAMAAILSYVRSAEKPVTDDEVALAVDIPRMFAAFHLLRLEKDGLVTTLRGGDDRLRYTVLPAAASAESGDLSLTRENVMDVSVGDMLRSRKKGWGCVVAADAEHLTVQYPTLGNFEYLRPRDRLIFDLWRRK